MRRKFIWAKCPKCEFNNGGFHEGDVTPTRPMPFICRRDRYYDEKDKQMYLSLNYCMEKWDIAVTEEQYEKIFTNFGRKIIIYELQQSLEEADPIK